MSSELLHQSDIDALLAAVDSEGINEEESDGRLYSRHRDPDEPVDIRPYDFQHPERVSVEQMRALESLHETFARVFGASMSGFLRTIVEIRVATVRQQTFGEFTSALPNPTAFVLLHPDALDGPFFLEMSPLIVYPLIDRMLGGTKHKVLVPRRSITAIEQRLFTVVLERAVTAIEEMWDAVGAIRFSLGEIGSNPQLAQMVPPNEVVIAIGFEFRMADHSGTMNLCVPFNVIEPVIDRVNAQSWFKRTGAGQDDRYRSLVTQRLSDAAVEVEAVLGETSMTMEDLLGLDAGDLIPLDREVSAPVSLRVEGVDTFRVRMGQSRGRRAVCVERRIAEPPSGARSGTAKAS